MKFATLLSRNLFNHSPRFSWQRRSMAFVLCFLLFFTSVPTELFSGGFFIDHSNIYQSVAHATDFAEAPPSGDDLEINDSFFECEPCELGLACVEHGYLEGERRYRSSFDDSYQLAPEDFYFAPDSESDFADLELIEISPDSNIFYNEDTGEITEEFFSVSVRVEDDDGYLIEVDPSLIESEKHDYAFESAVGNSTNYFPEAIDGETPFLLAYDNYEIRFTLQKDAEVILEEIEELEFEDIFQEVEERPLAALYSIDEDMSFRVTSSDIGIKSEFVLYALPDSNIFTYELELTNLYALLSSEATEIALFSTETSGPPVAFIPPGLMWDSSEDGALSDAIDYELTRVRQGRYLLSLVVCEDYLNCESRVFPIIVDPTLTWQSAFNVNTNPRSLNTHLVRSASPNTVFTNRGTMPVGNNVNGIGRTFLLGGNFNTPLLGRSISAANLHVRQINNPSHRRNINVSVHRVLPPPYGETVNLQT